MKVFQQVSYSSPILKCSRDDEWGLRKLELLQGCRVKGIAPCGKSYWTRTAKIDTEQVDGTQLSFFLKVAKYNPTEKSRVGQLMR